MDDKTPACPQCDSADVEKFDAGETFHLMCRRCGREEDGNGSESHVTPGRGVLRHEPTDPERHATYFRPLREGDDLSAIIQRRAADPRVARIVLTYRTPEGRWTERVVFGSAAPAAARRPDKAA